MIRASRATRVRGLGGPILNLAPPVHTCPPGYHWVDTPSGPIAAVRRVGGISACVKNVALHLNIKPPPAPVAPTPRAPVRVHFTPPAAPAPSAPVRTAVTRTLAPVQTAPDRAEAPGPEGETCPTCWPWWWLLVAGAAGAAVVGVARSSKKKKKNGERRLNPYVARIVNAGTHHVIRAVMR